MTKSPSLIFIILCDNVTEEGGKFSFVGLFDRIMAPAFPALHSKSFLVTRWGNGVGKSFKQRLVMKNLESNEIVFDSASVEKAFDLVDTKATHTTVGQLHIQLPREGEYKIEVYLDGIKNDAELYFSASVGSVVGSHRLSHFLAK